MQNLFQVKIVLEGHKAQEDLPAQEVKAAWAVKMGKWADLAAMVGQKQWMDLEIWVDLVGQEALVDQEAMEDQ